MTESTMLLSTIAAIFLLSSGCSQEDCDDVIERATGAAHELNGRTGAPDVVRKQRRKENHRQNSEWTTENQGVPGR